MVTFALCTAFGVFLCVQFSKAYFLGKKKHKELIEDGYTGYFSLEWERKWEPELEPIEIALEHYKKLLEVIHE